MSNRGYSCSSEFPGKKKKKKWSRLERKNEHEFVGVRMHLLVTMSAAISVQSYVVICIP